MKQQETSTIAFSARMGALAQYGGALVSVALLVGVAIWGYKLVMRDVSGVPVVQAAQGPMREAPVDPGGNLALNTGLAVNDIAAQGQPGQQGDRLMLAPATAGLTEEDLLVQPTAEMGEVVPEGVGSEPIAPTTLEDDTVLPASQAEELAEPTAAEAAGEEVAAVVISPDQPMTADDILAFADQIAAGAEPLSELAEGTDVPVALSLDGNEAVADALADALVEAGGTTGGIEVISTSVPGVTTAFRPPARPANLQTSGGSVAAQPAAAEPSVVEQVVAEQAAEPFVIPAGATLVQLGAFDTAEQAAAEWARLSGRFGEFMIGKERVVQAATSGGRAFFRLRALGFDDFDDANRFCTALVAEGALCIPVASD